MSSKVINTILNLKDNFSDTVNKVAQNTSSFRSSMQKTESQAISMKKTVSDAFGDMKEYILEGIGIGAGMDIFNTAKESLGEMINFGSDLQKSLNGIQTATGYTNDAMLGIKQVMTDIYNDNFGENFEDIGAAIKIIGQQTSATGDELKGLTENALLVKDTFDFDVSESVRSANMLMNQFGLTGDQAYNLIAQGAQYGLDKNGDLLDTINEYSVHFKQLGINSDDMFNMLVNGAASGTFSVDKLGDAVKEFGIRSKDGSKSTRGAFQSLGLDADKLSQQFAQGGDIGEQAFTEVNTKLLDMKDPLQQNQIGVALWGSMWEDLGVSGIKALTDTQGEISNTNDALKDINKIQYNDIGSAFEGIKRNIQTSILIPISDEVLPRLQDFSQWFVDKIPSIKESVSSITNNFLNVASSILDNNLPALQNLASSISDLATTIWKSILPAFDSIKPDNWDSVSNAIKDIIDKATEVVNYIKDNWNTIEPIVKGITEAVISWKVSTIAVETATKAVTLAIKAWESIEMIIWGIKNATNAWELAQWALDVAMDANPIGVVTLAIAALGFAIYEVVTHWKDIWNWVNKVWDVIQDNPILLFISTVLNPFGTAIMEIVTHWKDICEWVEKAWDWLTKWNDTKMEDKSGKVTVTDGAAVTMNSNNSSDDEGTIFDTGNNATGTQYWKGGPTWVGEHGKELINLPSGSKVYTSSQTNSMANGNGGISIINNINIHGNMVGNEEFADSIGQHIYNKLQLAMINS